MAILTFRKLAGEDALSRGLLFKEPPEKQKEEDLMS